MFSKLKSKIMDNLNPGCSRDINNSESYENLDLEVLTSIQGINVWGQTQEILEEQALGELEILSQEASTVEEGELLDNPETEVGSKGKSIVATNTSLDINSYIKKQEEFKKHQEYKRSLQVSEKSRGVAKKISTNHNIKANSKRKSSELNELKSKKVKLSEKIELNLTKNKQETHNNSGSEYFPSDESTSDLEYEPERKQKLVVKQNRLSKAGNQKVVDDGSLKCYKYRLNEYYKQLEHEMNVLGVSDGEESEEICSGFKVSSKIWNSLYSYQQEGLKWLWDLHVKSTGGLLGDDMGLGKTVQIITFLGALSFSRVISRYCRYTGLGPTIIVCPTTVIHQWVQHFHEWAPEFRVAVLHQSGSYKGQHTQLIKDIYKAKGILVTSYSGILKFKGVLAELDWHYLIIDEGHKIRNPAAKVTKAAKQFRTPHKILLTGSPMQNNLQELWSLFDFIIPGMLGSLQVFQEHFIGPIMQGGYSNSTPMQEATALSVATALKDMITPFLLRRSKTEVRKDICLPYKNEQVLFCSLTDEQRDLYKGFLMSDYIGNILGRTNGGWIGEKQRRANILVAITSLRKICNHPDIYLHEGESNHDESQKNLSVDDSYGYYKRCGKMIVVAALLKIWKKQKHRVLLFTQSRAMIRIFEDFLEQQQYKYLKMDGSTSISSRQTIINLFNQDSTYDVFLLTTRVGGLGVNLTGGNRVIIYDPDWNPATDSQAKERAWRIGQQKQVTVYRLLTASTIEEKIYMRQVFKQLLSNKVLLDPKTQKFFKSSDLHDLFSLQEQTEASNPETANIFKNSRVSLQERIKEKKSSKTRKTKANLSEELQFSEDKIQEMKKLAQQIAKGIASTTTNESSTAKRKSAHELELELELKKKMEERAYMKTLTPQELRIYNKQKLIAEDTTINKIDNFQTNISFTKALEISEKSSKIYHDLKEEKIDIDNALVEYDTVTTDIVDNNCNTRCNMKRVNGFKNSSVNQDNTKNDRKTDKRKHKDCTIVDSTGEFEGEKISGLLKVEIKKSHHRAKEKIKSESQDNYVLEKLLSKKGVHAALQHDVIVQSGSKNQVNRFRLHSEAQAKTNLALEAIRKSRLKSWSW